MIFVQNILSTTVDISPKNFLSLKTFYSEFQYIEEWFADQNPKPLEIEDKHYFSYQSVKYKKIMCYVLQPIKVHSTFVKDYGFLSFAKNMTKNIGENISNNFSGKYS